MATQPNTYTHFSKYLDLSVGWIKISNLTPYLKKNLLLHIMYSVSDPACHKTNSWTITENCTNVINTCQLYMQGWTMLYIIYIHIHMCIFVTSLQGLWVTNKLRSINITNMLTLKTFKIFSLSLPFLLSSFGRDTEAECVCVCVGGGGWKQNPNTKTLLCTGD